MTVDVPWLLAINQIARQTPWLHGTVVAYANYGLVLFAAMMLAGWWVARRAADPVLMGGAMWVPLGMLAALGVNQLIVGAVAEARPYASLPGLLVLAHRTSDPAFPSDHAVMAGAVAAGLALVNRGLGWLAALAAGLMAFARVYIAAHYPHDVIAGLLVGALISLLGYLALHRLLTRIVLLAGSTAPRPVLTTEPGAPPGPRSNRSPTGAR